MIWSLVMTRRCLYGCCCCLLKTHQNKQKSQNLWLLWLLLKILRPHAQTNVSSEDNPQISNSKEKKLPRHFLLEEVLPLLCPSLSPLRWGTFNLQLAGFPFAVSRLNVGLQGSDSCAFLELLHCLNFLLWRQNSVEISSLRVCCRFSIDCPRRFVFGGHLLRKKSMKSGSKPPQRLPLASEPSSLAFWPLCLCIRKSLNGYEVKHNRTLIKIFYS